jgi:hypothetical protein
MGDAVLFFVLSAFNGSGAMGLRTVEKMPLSSRHFLQRFEETFEAALKPPEFCVWRSSLLSRCEARMKFSLQDN